jgi:hypothetical protein
MSNLKPRFQIEKLEGTRKRPVAEPKTNEKGILLGGFDYTDTEVDAGWMVYFPSGASIHVWTRDEMERQGFLNPASLVNMDTGDEQEVSSMSLKARSEQKNKESKNKAHHTI